MFVGTNCIDGSQSPIFPFDRRDRARLPLSAAILIFVLPLMAAILIFRCTEGAGVGDYSSRGGGEKN